jgi:hypothetical protein
MTDEDKIDQIRKKMLSYVEENYFDVDFNYKFLKQFIEEFFESFDDRE